MWRSAVPSEYVVERGRGMAAFGQLQIKLQKRQHGEERIEASPFAFLEGLRSSLAVNWFAVRVPFA